MAGKFRWGLLAVLAAAAVRADDPKPAPPTPPDLAPLLRKLDADLPAARDEAEAALVKLGLPILDRLPKPEDPALSKEQNKRLERVRGKLWEARLRADLEGAWVEMPKGPQPLLELLRETEKQTGNAIKDLREEFQQEPLNPSIAWDGQRRRFWDAFDELCKAGNVRPTHLAGEGALALQANGAPRGEVAVRSGAFKFVLNGLTLEKSFGAAEAAPNAAANPTQCLVRMQALFEPRFRVLQVEAKAADFKFFDDRGKELKPVRPDQTYSFGVDEGAHHFDMSLEVQAPERAAKKLARIEGEIAVLVPASRAQLEFPDWSAEKPAEKKAAGLAVTVSEAKDEGEELWSFTVTVKGPPPAGDGPAADSYLAAAADQQVWLQKPDGTRVTPNAGKNASEGDGVVATEYVVTGAPGKLADYKLMVRLPTGIVRAPVKFQFKDIDLP